jgi:16S rRNA C967 or C1407 C5-methylase (RsmB/RsmF family)
MTYDDAQKDMQKLLATQEGQKLLDLLSADGGKTLKRASAALRSGDQAAAQATMAPLLENSQVKALLASLEKTMGHG